MRSLHKPIIARVHGHAVGVGSGTLAGGLGLAGMRERLSLVDGKLKIESSPGAGTTLVARIRLDGQGADS